MRTKALLATALMLAVSFAMVVPADDIDADGGTIFEELYIEGGNNISVERGNDIVLHIHYTSDSNKTLRVIVTDKKDNKEVYREDVNFKSGTYTCDITFTYDRGDSPVYMKIAFVQGGLAPSIDFTINYTSSIWGNPALYVAIIIVVILVVVFVVYKARTAPKRDKNTLTFEQIDAERQAQRRASESLRKEGSVKSQKQKYLASKKKKQ